MVDFNALVSSTNPSVALSDLGCVFGPVYEKHELILQGNQCMMRDDANGLCAPCYEASDYMYCLSQAGQEKVDLAALVDGFVLKPC